MKIGKLIAASAALTLAATPAMAAQNQAASLSVSKSVRAGAVTKGKSKLAGGVGIFGLIILAGIIAIPVIDVVKDDNSDSN
jgi:hypothetical protein